MSCLHAEISSKNTFRLVDDSGQLILISINNNTLDVKQQPKALFPLSFSTEHPVIKDLYLNGSENSISILKNDLALHQIYHDCFYTCGEWSPTKNSVFFALTSDGCIHVYDLLQNDELPIEIKAITSCRLVSITFACLLNKQYLGMAAQDGSSYILKLPKELHRSVNDLDEFTAVIDRLKSAKNWTAEGKIEMKSPQLSYKASNYIK